MWPIIFLPWHYCWRPQSNYSIHLNNNIVEAGALVLSYCLVKRIHRNGPERMRSCLVQYNTTHKQCRDRYCFKRWVVQCCLVPIYNIAIATNSILALIYHVVKTAKSQKDACLYIQDLARCVNSNNGVSNHMCICAKTINRKLFPRKRYQESAQS